MSYQKPKVANKTLQPIKQAKSEVVAPSASESNYDEDEFESMSLSKSVVINNALPTIKSQEITCFDCKQKIPKGQAGHHKEICPKAIKRNQAKKSIENNSEH
jgi:hypothetical protein